MFRKAITDIAIEGNEISVSRQLDLSVAEVEDQVAALTYGGVGLEKDLRVENAKLPPFALAFYYHLFSKRAIPTEGEFFHRYLSFSAQEVEETETVIEGEAYSTAGLKARLLRTYPSLIRDFHFYLLLNESKKFDRVTYSLSQDYYRGLDLCIYHSAKAFHLSLFIKTKRSGSFKKKKVFRHDYKDIKEIELELDFSELQRHGAISLCTKLHVDQVYQQVVAL
jgi:hypothetical protein